MTSIIKNRVVVEDAFTVVRAAEDGALPTVDALPAGKIIVPFALWKEHKSALIASRSKDELGVWLAPDDEPADIAPDFYALSVIAVDFPVFRDGRGFSIGRLLRGRYNWTGELRAIGDVLRDQVFFHYRCGFDAYAVRADKDINDALSAFNEFTELYQGANDNPEPLFRRRAALNAALGAYFQAKVECLDALLDSIAARHERVKLASSLAAEDMVLTHAILSRGVKIGIFSLNTGRLHAETLGMLDRVKERYGYDIEQFHPQQYAVDAYVRDHGLNAFYESIDLRKSCCHIRKVEPLNRALADVSAWVTGQRREQSVIRAELHEEERDEPRNIAKFNPLVDWTETDVWDYLKANDVLVNPLHARGYPSIGCEPCTRAIRPGEDSRTGRWWWESRDTKECGLHITNIKIVEAAPSSAI